MILKKKSTQNVLLFLIWFAITQQAGCGCSPTSQSQQPLEQILREEVKKAKIAANSNPLEDGKQLILEVAAKAFGVEGQGAPLGKLIIHSESTESKGQRRFVASWQRSIEFKLGSTIDNIQEIIWLDVGGVSGTTIDLTGVPSSLVDISGRLKDAKRLDIGMNDPLQQVLTLSGYPDKIRITALADGKYQAEIETHSAEIIVDDSTLISAKLHK